MTEKNGCCKEDPMNWHPQHLEAAIWSRCSWLRREMLKIAWEWERSNTSWMIEQTELSQAQNKLLSLTILHTNSTPKILQSSFSRGGTGNLILYVLMMTGLLGPISVKSKDWPTYLKLHPNHSQLKHLWDLRGMNSS